jgi:ankyrin repeat protein
LNAAMADDEFAGCTPFSFAAHDNRLDGSKLLIAAGADVNMARVDDGATPLHVAAELGHADVVSVLLETAGVDMNAAMTDGDHAGLTPLFIAAWYNRLDVVTLLLATGADVNKACADGCSPLHIAAQNRHAGGVSLLLKTAGVALNKATTFPLAAGGFVGGNTPSFVAAQEDRLYILKLLIAAGADVHMARDDGLTPLHAAAELGHADVVSVLIETVDVDLNAALTDDEDAPGVTPLFFAAQENRLAVVTLLLAAGADVNKACADGYTPLHIAAELGHAGVVSVLLEAEGVDPNAALTDGEIAGITPSYLAAQSNRLDVLTLLIDAGADVNRACVNGCTSMHAAAHRRGRKRERNPR